MLWQVELDLISVMIDNVNLMYPTMNTNLNFVDSVSLICASLLLNNSALTENKTPNTR